ncbi:transcription factor bHLH106-like [Olea europaea subsp. europaea]|uniref:Transcription factor bHLH106-like n=2 Tax=Olea europaea subsp. europaea TaxID=158383 RepID=A0A8S0VND5_OLEEU|nr:transcription factor bHLH106-like [Olea europaea subsp. europaea]
MKEIIEKVASNPKHPIPLPLPKVFAHCIFIHTMQSDNSPENSNFHQVPDGNGFIYGFPAMESYCSSSFYPMEVPEFTHAPAEVRALTASENHKEAERKRRERINCHLDRLRSLLLCNSKTDKASLLAKVVERVRELKQQTSEIMQSDQTFPSESDEITVIQNENNSTDGKSLIKASLCCEDRINLFPELIEILNSLPLSPLKAEIVTLGGRIRNLIVLASDKDQADESVVALRDALKSLILRSSYGPGEGSKRRRILGQRVIG